MDINDPEAIFWLAEDVAESAGYDRSVAREMAIPQELQAVADQYQEAIDNALAEWCERRGCDLESIYDAGVDGVLVHLTVVKSGRSIRDGELDHLMRRPEQQDLADYLESRLSRYADFTGAGRFEDAIRNAVYEAEEGDEDEYEPNYRLSAGDKRAIKAFAERRAAVRGGKLLDSPDGEQLHKMGLGGGVFAEWVGGKVHLAGWVPAVKSDEVILRAMRKEIPPFDWAGYEGSSRDQARRRRMTRNANAARRRRNR